MEIQLQTEIDLGHENIATYSGQVAMNGKVNSFHSSTHFLHS
jgi:hypothetical protein